MNLDNGQAIKIGYFLVIESGLISQDSHAEKAQKISKKVFCTVEVS